MNRRLAVLLALTLGLVSAVSALTLRLGGAFGTRNFNDAKIRETYGGGEAYSAGVEVGLGRGWTAGFSLENGPTLSGKLGLSESNAQFSLWGLDFTAGYELRLRKLGFFIRAGYGLYHYRQTVDYEYVQDYKVDAWASTFVAAAGLKYYPWNFLFLSAGAKYVPLKVKPYDQTVDLGGWRWAAGLGLAFDF